MDEVQQSTLEDVKSHDVAIEVAGKPCRLKFGYSTWAKLEERYGSINVAMEVLKGSPIKALPAIIACAARVEAGQEVPTEQEVLDWLDDMQLPEMMDYLTLLRTSMFAALPQVTEAEKKGSTPQ
jgi:hypothetical protein